MSQISGQTGLIGIDNCINPGEWVNPEDERHRDAESETFPIAVADL